MDRSIFIVFQLLTLLLLILTQFVGHSAGYENDEGEEIKTEVSVNLYDESWESSWVPVISGGVIITLVISISVFACCLHCPGCYINKRTNPDQIV